MADKFPSLEDIDTGIASDAIDGGDADFLAREKELLGDEFNNADDEEILKSIDNEDEEDAAIKDFNENFPSVDNAVPGHDESHFEAEAEHVSQGFNSLEINDYNDQYQGESQPLKEWKERRDLEIAKRDEIAAKTKQDIKEKAQKNIDDFYENYNNKKDTFIEKTRKEQEDFLSKRDNFFKDGTVWDRSLKLINFDKDDTLKNGRDKTRLKKLLKSLKGKENVPGAAGY